MEYSNQSEVMLKAVRKIAGIKNIPNWAICATAAISPKIAINRIVRASFIFQQK
jgi:hypothetical protein